MPLIKSNVHTHTEFCDGKDSMELMVKAAIDKGFETLGFSPHSFTPFDFAYCCMDFDAYRREFERLKEKYAGKIKLISGVELDAYGVMPEGTDYVITSAHYVRVGGEYYSVDGSRKHFDTAVNEGFGGDKLKLAECYYDTLVQAVKATLPDVIGHFDLVDLYGNFDDDGYREIALAAAEKLKGTDSLVEVNLGRLFKGKGGAYPADFIIEYMARNGFEFVLSGDAHCVEALGFAFDEQVRLLKALGVKRLAYFDGKDKKYIDL